MEKDISSYEKNKNKKRKRKRKRKRNTNLDKSNIVQYQLAVINYNYIEIAHLFHRTCGVH